MEKVMSSDNVEKIDELFEQLTKIIDVKYEEGTHRFGRLLQLSIDELIDYTEIIKRISIECGKVNDYRRLHILSVFDGFTINKIVNKKLNELIYLTEYMINYNIEFRQDYHSIGLEKVREVKRDLKNDLDLHWNEYCSIRCRMQNDVYKIIEQSLLYIKYFLDINETTISFFASAVESAYEEYCFLHAKEREKFISSALYKKDFFSYKIIENRAQEATAYHWGKAYEEYEKIVENDALAKVLLECDNINGLFSIRDKHILKTIYDNFTTVKDLMDFYRKMTDMNYIKSKILKLKMEERKQTEEYKSKYNFESGSHPTIIEHNEGTVYSGKVTVKGVPTKPTVEQIDAWDTLDRLVRAQLGNQQKDMLMPVRAAIIASIPLPFNNEKGFNERYGTAIKQPMWSKYINGDDGIYDERHLIPIVNQFKSFSGENAN